jgi:hypothetical protein
LTGCGETSSGKGTDRVAYRCGRADQALILASIFEGDDVRDLVSGAKVSPSSRHRRDERLLTTVMAIPLIPPPPNPLIARKQYSWMGVLANPQRRLPNPRKRRASWSMSLRPN